MQKHSPPMQSAQKGIVLIEALIAILIFSFAVLGIIGLQAAMIKNTVESKYRADASYIAQQQIGRLWTDADDLGNSQVFGDKDISYLLPNGNLSVTQTGAGQITVTVTWMSPGETQPHNFTTATSIAKAEP
jgi:type IV pilus assembly protein PilV